MICYSKIAIRDSNGSALAELGQVYENLIVLDAGLAVATKTCKFQNEYLERHINCGIAENNMVTITAGLATCGKIPFVSFLLCFCPEEARNRFEIWCYACGDFQ